METLPRMETLPLKDDRPILALDFDGVIHRYAKGWQDGTIYDRVTEGFAEWAKEAVDHFRLVIVSSRFENDGKILQARDWLRYHGIDPLQFEFSLRRPPAFLTIDDRAITFTGDWKDYPTAWLKRFKPWNMK